jgi:cell division protein FtsQ
MAREPKKAPAPRSRWRLFFGLTVLAALCVSSAMATLKVRDYLNTDPQFTLSRYQKDSLLVDGLRYASRSKVQRVFALDFQHSIFSIPLDERRRRLLAIDWIEDVTVSRIWPDRLVVHIRERKPVAFVYFRSGVLLIDVHGVLLEPPAAMGSPATFGFPVLSGVGEDETEPQREERVRAMMRVVEEFGDRAKDISEVNASDPDDMSVVVKLDMRAMTVLLGDVNFGRRYRNFVNHYPEIRQQSPDGKTFDLRLDDRITVKD